MRLPMLGWAWKHTGSPLMMAHAELVEPFFFFFFFQEGNEKQLTD
jgi:hypothetical protein